MCVFDDEMIPNLLSVSDCLEGGSLWAESSAFILTRHKIGASLNAVPFLGFHLAL